jgi:ubiquinone/menaquinone biosynthesis C-methylase UbiE
MKRWREENINTPEHFDHEWRTGDYHFQSTRLRAFTALVKSGDRVLDFGCGLFGWAEYLLNEQRIATVEAHGLDFSSAAGEILAQRSPSLQFHLGNVLAAPFPDGHFDLTGAGELIEHMEDPAALVAEMARVTRPGGTIVIGTVDPHCSDSVRNGCVYPEHLWEFTSDDLIALLLPHSALGTMPRYWRVGNYDFVRAERRA